MTPDNDTVGNRWFWFDLPAMAVATKLPNLLPIYIEADAAPNPGGFPIGDQPGLTVTRLNDHHTYLAVEPGAEVAVGEVLRFGLSHPCTAFDKWREIPVIDDDHRVVDVLHTYF